MVLMTRILFIRRPDGKVTSGTYPEALFWQQVKAAFDLGCDWWWKPGEEYDGKA